MVRIIRERLGLTEPELALLIGVPHTLIEKSERGPSEARNEVHRVIRSLQHLTFYEIVRNACQRRYEKSEDVHILLSIINKGSFCFVERHFLRQVLYCSNRHLMLDTYCTE